MLGIELRQRRGAPPAGSEATLASTAPRLPPAHPLDQPSVPCHFSLDAAPDPVVAPLLSPRPSPSPPIRVPGGEPPDHARSLAHGRPPIVCRGPLAKTVPVPIAHKSEWGVHQQRRHSPGVGGETISRLIASYVDPETLARHDNKSRPGRLPLELIQADRRGAFLEALRRLPRGRGWWPCSAVLLGGYSGVAAPRFTRRAGAIQHRARHPAVGCSGTQPSARTPLPPDAVNVPREPNRVAQPLGLLLGRHSTFARPFGTNETVRPLLRVNAFGKPWPSHSLGQRRGLHRGERRAKR
jgi:hypothetical protein